VSFDNQVLEDHCPNVAEDGFDIENHEEHGHEVEFDREAGRTITDGKHSALVSFIFHSFCFSSLAEVEAHDERNSCESNSEKNLEKDREKVSEHGVERGKRKPALGNAGFVKDCWEIASRKMRNLRSR
jgi:hypothetical protein